MIDQSAGATKMVLAGAALLLAIACDANGPEGSSQLELSGPSESFGAVPVGGRGEVRRFTLTNEGDAPTGELLVRLAGADAGEFAIVRDDCSGQVLPVAGTCSIDLQLRPQTPGIKQAQLSVADDAGRAVSAALSGSGADGGLGGLVMQSSAYDFGDAGVSATGPTHGFMVRNLGPVTSGPVTVELAGPGSASYSIVGNTCAGAQLVVSGACLVTVRFQPATVGTIAGLLTASASPGGSATAVFSGTGGSAGTITAERAAYDFGTRQVGVLHPPVALVFRNSGTTPTGALSLHLAGTDASEFSFAGGNCEGARLVPGQQCTVSVAFAPQTSGAKSGVLEVQDAFGTFASASLAGVGELVLLEFSPGFVDFQEVEFGASRELTVSISNQGDATTAPLSVAVEVCDYYYGGCQPSPYFSLASTTCAATALAPGATCTVAVVFSPQPVGYYYAAQVSVVAGGNTYSVALSGRGAFTQFSVAPEALSFPATQVGGSSADQTVTVTNSGGHPSSTVTVNVEVCGYYYCEPTTHFEIGPNDCAGAILPAGGSCTIPVSFRPDAPGLHVAQLTLGGTGSFRYVSLSGEGVP